MGIQSRHAAKVNSARYAIVFALVLFSTAQSGSSARAEGSDPAVPRVPSPADTLPNIEARSFDVRVAKRSKSAKTYLFEDINQARTRVGKILLLRRDSQPVMAFRIVKTYYPAKNEFAAKQVRTYGDIAKIEPGSSYSGLEKVSDVVAPPPTAQDRADLKELESAPVQPALETLPAPTPTPEASAVPAAPSCAAPTRS
jgi:hypothetical protein